MHVPLSVCRLVFGFIISLIAVAAAHATPALTMDLATGEVLYGQDGTRQWFPASTTKLMTVFVALSAVRDRQIALDTPLVISERAHLMPPSKMGFPVGTQVTLDNALKMLMVPSANDIAITVAEGVAGSVEAFADDMNRAAAQLGLHESHFVNPNGLPDPDHYSSARDMAIIARALYQQFPEQAQLFNLGALSLGSRIIGNHNNLLGRYPGVDGMKTGFTCSAGFNIVATSFRDGRRLIVVVFGAPSVAARSAKVSALFDRGFAGIDRPLGSILSLASSTDGSAPDMRDHICRNRAPLLAQFNAEVESLDGPLLTPASNSLGLTALSPESALLFGSRTRAPAEPMALKINSMPAPLFTPTPVHIGAEPGYTGAVAQARAPHTPIGSEPQPATAAAYAAAPEGEALQNIGGTPLKVDMGALPMRGRPARIAAARGRALKARQAAIARLRHPSLKAAAEAPKTRVLAGAEGDEKPSTQKITKKPISAKAIAAKKNVSKPVAARPPVRKNVALKAPAKTSKVKAAAK